MYRLYGLVTLSLSLALLIACTGSGNSTGPSAASPAAASSGNAQTVTVRGTDTLKFEPTTVTVKAGQPVKLTFTNTGQTLHDWSLPQGAAQPVKIEAAGGQSATATFTIDRPGTYAYICSQPGHEAGGMKGTLTAQ